MLKKLFKRRSRRNQEYDIVAGHKSLPVSVNINGDKSTISVGADGLSEGEKNEFFAQASPLSLKKKQRRKKSRQKMVDKSRRINRKK